MNKSERILENLSSFFNEEDLTGKDSDYVHKTLSTEAKAIHDHTHTGGYTKEGLRQIDPKHEALAEYVDYGYKHMNSKLRKIKTRYQVTPEITKTLNRHIKNLKSLTKSQTNHSFTAYRGSGHLGDLKEGDTIHDKGFTSVSTKDYVAGNFKKDSDNSKQGHRFKIHIPEGTKGYYASGHEGIFPGEKEFILHPGTKFRVGHMEKGEHGHDDWTHLHIHSQED